MRPGTPGAALRSPGPAPTRDVPRVRLAHDVHPRVSASVTGNLPVARPVSTGRSTASVRTGHREVVSPRVTFNPSQVMSVSMEQAFLTLAASC